MKHNIFYLLLATMMINNTVCNNINKSTPPSLTKKESEVIETLYLLNKYEPSFEKKDDFKLDYALDILDKHIQVLKYRISTKESNWKEELVGLGIMEVCLAPLLISLYQGLKLFITHDLGEITIEKSLLSTLSKVTFSRSEKKYLDSFAVKKITILCSYWEQFYLNISTLLQSLSPEEIKKLPYLAKKVVIKKTKNTIYICGGICILYSIPWICLAYHNITKYRKDLAEQLEYAERFYYKLYNEKERRRTISLLN
jgi:hypothetical protein